MNYHIDTIPLWDAVKEGAPCPFCAVMANAEAIFADRYLHGAVMEPDVRVQVNAKGFCREHWQLLYAQRKPLPVSLMLHTHLSEKRQGYDKALTGLQRAVDKGVGLMDAGALGKFNKKGGLQGQIAEVAERFEKAQHSCLLCERLETTLERYLNTFCAMFRDESEFARAIADGPGFCLPHTAALLRAAPGHLSGKPLEKLLTAVIDTTRRGLEQQEKDLYDYTQLYDYQNAASQPTPQVRDAVPRAINRLRGGRLNETPPEIPGG